jgi:NAD-dependent DNA ligase
MIVGKNPRTKLLKAQRLGLKLVSEAEFKELIRQ